MTTWWTESESHDVNRWRHHSLTCLRTSCRISRPWSSRSRSRWLKKGRTNDKNKRTEQRWKRYFGVLNRSHSPRVGLTQFRNQNRAVVLRSRLSSVTREHQQLHHDVALRHLAAQLPRWRHAVAECERRVADDGLVAVFELGDETSRTCCVWRHEMTRLFAVLRAQSYALHGWLLQSVVVRLKTTQIHRFSSKYPPNNKSLKCAYIKRFYKEPNVLLRNNNICDVRRVLHESWRHGECAFLDSDVRIVDEN